MKKCRCCGRANEDHADWCAKVFPERQRSIDPISKLEAAGVRLFTDGEAESIAEEMNATANEYEEYRVVCAPDNRAYIAIYNCDGEQTGTVGK